VEALERARQVAATWDERLRAALPVDLDVFDAHTHLGTDIDGMVGHYEELLGSMDRYGISRAESQELRQRRQQRGSHQLAPGLDVGDDELMCLKREQLPGMTVWVSESDTGAEPAGPVSPFLGIWQATNLVEDRDGAAAVYEGLFGSPTRVESFRQETYGYLGRTLYYGASPGADSLEIAQVHRTDTAMGRFWQRHGPSVYMITLDTDDMKSAREGLDSRQVRYATETNPAFDALYVHPSALAGSFVGIISERS